MQASRFKRSLVHSGIQPLTADGIFGPNALRLPRQDSLGGAGPPLWKRITRTHTSAATGELASASYRHYYRNPFQQVPGGDRPWPTAHTLFQALHGRRVQISLATDTLLCDAYRRCDACQKPVRSEDLAGRKSRLTTTKVSPHSSLFPKLRFTLHKLQTLSLLADLGLRIAV